MLSNEDRENHKALDSASPSNMPYVGVSKERVAICMNSFATPPSSTPSSPRKATLSVDSVSIQADSLVGVCENGRRDWSRGFVTMESVL